MPSMKETTATTPWAREFREPKSEKRGEESEEEGIQQQIIGGGLKINKAGSKSRSVEAGKAKPVDVDVHHHHQH